MNKKALEEGLEANLQFEKRGGVLPVIVQEYYSNKVLMLAYTNREAFKRVYTNRLVLLPDNLKKEIRLNEVSSGCYVRVIRIEVDYNQDTLIYLVEEGSKGTKESIIKQQGDRMQ